LGIIRKILPLLSHLSLALMLTILANGVLFFHSHELENGRIITHAHPILTQEQQEKPDHGHTEMELIILDLISHAEYFVYDFSIIIPEMIESEKGIDIFFISQEFFTEVSTGFNLRGPPITIA
jgi:hypothetical protein